MDGFKPFTAICQVKRRGFVEGYLENSFKELKSLKKPSSLVFISQR
jgi:hypothetical protein